MTQTQLDWSEVNQIIENALREDIGSGDITTNLLFTEDASGSPKSLSHDRYPRTQCRAIIMAKEGGVVAGLPVAEAIFRKLDRDIIWNEEKKDGEKVKPNQILAEISGSQRAILTCERLALNFIQRLSGIATLTSRFIEAIEGLPVKILDTRKTAPGLRVLDKYAVRVGGGYNHRFGLYDGVLIKDNHIKLAGGITRAVKLIRERTRGETKIEVETSTLDEVKEAIAVEADTIMLDNMPLKIIKEAVELINGKALIEVSGGVRLENVRQIAEIGIDFISVGSLTHSPPALDIALYIRES